MLGVDRLDALGVSTGAVPVLRHAWDIEAAVGSYTAAFLATHAVACLADLEDEIVAMLKGRCMLPLPPWHQASAPVTGAAGAAAEEIDIDSVDEETEERPTGGEPAPGTPRAGSQAGAEGLISGFESFGAGPLAHHPAVAARWPPGQVRAPLRYSDLGPQLIDFLRSRVRSGYSHGGAPGVWDGPRRGGGGATAAPDVPAGEMCAWLEAWLGAPLASAGVVLVASALPSAARALGFAVHAAAEMEVSHLSRLGGGVRAEAGDREIR